MNNTVTGPGAKSALTDMQYTKSLAESTSQLVESKSRGQSQSDMALSLS